MADSNMNDSVGRKIVEALKMQSAEVQEGLPIDDAVNEPEVAPQNIQPQDEETNSFEEQDLNDLGMNFQSQASTELPSDLQMKIQNQLKDSVQPTFQTSYIDNAFNKV